MLLAEVSLDLSRIKNRIPSLFSESRERGGGLFGNMFLYGFGYGLATTGCTFPIFLSLIVLPIASGRFIRGFSTFATFALAVGLLMILATVLIGLAKEALMKKLVASTIWIKRISGIILIMVGFYLGYFFVRAGM